MHTATGEGVEIDRQRGHQSLSLACLHLGDAAVVQDHSAHQLDVEMAHVQDPLAAFPAYGEGLRKKLIHGGLEVFLGNPDRGLIAGNLIFCGGQRFHGRPQPLAEFGCFGPQSVV